MRSPGTTACSAVRPKRWLSWGEIADAFSGAPDPDWDEDRHLVDQFLVDPWSREP